MLDIFFSLRTVAFADFFFLLRLYLSVHADNPPKIRQSIQIQHEKNNFKWSYFLLIIKNETHRKTTFRYEDRDEVFPKSKL